jgi:AraC-like DNA-binding protein
MAGDPSAVPEGIRDFTLERDAAAVRRLLDDMVGVRFPLRRIRVPIAAPADPAAFARALGAAVRFGGERLELEFGAGWRDLEMPYGNPLLEETYERQCRELVTALAQRSSEVERVVDLLVRCGGRWPTIDDTAGRLGASARTLRRRLDEQGTHFRALVEQVRRKQAEELLGGTRLTVEQVADALGYAETASFTHAFKRWTGSSPRAFRGDASARALAERE